MSNIERHRLELLKVLAHADKLPKVQDLADTIGCRTRSHARYYLKSLETGGMMIVSETKLDGVVTQHVSLTPAAYAAIGEQPPAEPRTISRRYFAKRPSDRSAKRLIREPQPEPEPAREATILGSLQPFAHDWDGDGFLRERLEEARERSARRALTIGGHKPQDLDTGEESSSLP